MDDTFAKAYYNIESSREKIHYIKKLVEFLASFECYMEAILEFKKMYKVSTNPKILFEFIDEKKKISDFAADPEHFLKHIDELKKNFEDHIVKTPPSSSRTLFNGWEGHRYTRPQR